MIDKLKTFLLLFAITVFSCTADGDFRSRQDAKVESRSADDEEEMLDDAAEEENEISIDLGALPGVVTEAIAAKYPGSTLKEADRITQSDGSTTFDIEIRFNGEVIEVMYDASGSFLGEEGEED